MKKAHIVSYVGRAKKDVSRLLVMAWKCWSHIAQGVMLCPSQLCSHVGQVMITCRSGDDRMMVKTKDRLFLAIN